MSTVPSYIDSVKITFEYDVPSGFKALCTKNINTQEYN